MEGLTNSLQTTKQCLNFFHAKVYTLLSSCDLILGLLFLDVFLLSLLV